MRNETRNRNRKEKWTAPVVLAAVLAAWQIAAVCVNMPHILPSPAAVACKIWELRESLFLHHLPATMLTVAAGWGLSILIGTALAALMHFSDFAEAMLSPVLLLTQTIPVLCISPLFVLWFGYTLPARMLAVILSTFFAITLNTYQGFQSADPLKKEWMWTCGAGRRSIFLHLEVPAALPDFLTALKMTLPWAIIDAAVAEWLGANQGLGYFSKRMISKMDGAGVFAPIVILCVIALIGMAVLKHVDRKYITWRSES